MLRMKDEKQKIRQREREDMAEYINFLIAQYDQSFGRVGAARRRRSRLRAIKGGRK